MNWKTALLIAGCLASPAVARAAECQISDYRFTFGNQSSASMTVKSGVECTSSTYATGQLIRRISVVQTPQHGIARQDGNRWSYRSDPGFTGHDQFTLLISGQVISNAATLVVNVNVTE
jgi:hypothetical protein